MNLYQTVISRVQATLSKYLKERISPQILANIKQDVTEIMYDLKSEGYFIHDLPIIDINAVLLYPRLVTRLNIALENKSQNEEEIEFLRDKLLQLDDNKNAHSLLSVYFLDQNHDEISISVINTWGKSKLIIEKRV